MSAPRISHPTKYYNLSDVLLSFIAFILENVLISLDELRYGRSKKWKVKRRKFLTNTFFIITWTNHTIAWISVVTRTVKWSFGVCAVCIIVAIVGILSDVMRCEALNLTFTNICSEQSKATSLMSYFFNWFGGTFLLITKIHIAQYVLQRLEKDQDRNDHINVCMISRLWRECFTR